VPDVNGQDGLALIGIDVGTSSVRAIAFDQSGRRIAAAARPTPIQPTDTGGEYDPDRIYETVLNALTEIGAALAGRPVAGIAVSSFGESCVLIDADGRATAPTIAWYDRRTEGQARAVETAIGRDRVFEHSVEPIYTLAKLLWMREHWPDAFDRAARVLMMADWIAFRLCGEAATDPGLASRTLYFDIRRRRWSDELLALAGLTAEFPAPLAASGTPLGTVRTETLAETGLAGRPVVGVGGHDHIVGALATGLHRPGSVVNSIGTAEALLLAGGRPLADRSSCAADMCRGRLRRIATSPTSPAPCSVPAEPSSGHAASPAAPRGRRSSPRPRRFRSAAAG
jgi:xylulokinase